jgi:hypothetical protein
MRHLFELFGRSSGKLATLEPVSISYIEAGYILKLLSAISIRQLEVKKLLIYRSSGYPGDDTDPLCNVIILRGRKSFQQAIANSAVCTNNKPAIESRIGGERPYVLTCPLLTHLR